MVARASATAWWAARCPTGTGRADRDAARRQFGIEPGQTCLLVFGGSLGARRINQATIDAFGNGAPGDVLHAAGRRDHDELAARLDELGSPPHYHLHAYIDPFADALAAADLVVARSGGSVLEVAAAGLPSVLVPYPHATADHQTAERRATWSARAPPWWCPTTSSTARAWRARWRRCWARRTGWRPWAARPRRWRARTRRGWWPTRSSSAAVHGRA